MRSTRQFGERGEWWVVAQGALFVAAVIAPKKGAAWSPGWRRTGRIVGLPLALAGVGLGVAGFRALGENLTALPHPKEDATLVQDGRLRRSCATRSTAAPSSRRSARAY